MAWDVCATEAWQSDIDDVESGEIEIVAVAIDHEVDMGEIEVSSSEPAYKVRRSF